MPVTPPSYEIRVDDLSGSQIRALLHEHLAFVARHSPPQSIHALNLDGLRAAEITCWSIWLDDALVGCGALKHINDAHGEIKSMRTVASHHRRGVASTMLQHLIDEARRRGYQRLSLETGSQPAFQPARSLYARFGFTICGPFAAYEPDPNSVFMTLDLQHVDTGSSARA